MYPIRCFGLNVLSDVDLPGLPATTGEPEVTIRVVLLGADRQRVMSDLQTEVGENHDVLLHWTQFGSARIRDGCEIVLYPLPGVAETLTRHVIQGPSMGVLLHQRGFYLLHASAVSIRGRVVAFLGRKGDGKSTTAAALHSEGHALVTDDLLPVRVVPGREVLAAPGIPMLKLWEDSVRAGLNEDPQSMPLFQPEWGKRTRWGRSDAGGAPAPLSVIYLLDFLDDPLELFHIAPLPPREAFVELIRHAYLQPLLGPGAIGRAQVRDLEEILKRVRICRLSRIRSLAEVGRIAAAVVEDVLSPQVA